MPGYSILKIGLLLPMNNRRPTAALLLVFSSPSLVWYKPSPMPVTNGSLIYDNLRYCLSFSFPPPGGSPPLLPIILLPPPGGEPPLFSPSPPGGEFLGVLIIMGWTLALACPKNVLGGMNGIFSIRLGTGLGVCFYVYGSRHPVW